MNPRLTSSPRLRLTIAVTALAVIAAGVQGILLPKRATAAVAQRPLPYLGALVRSGVPANTALPARKTVQVASAPRRQLPAAGTTTLSLPPGAATGTPAGWHAVGNSGLSLATAKGGVSGQVAVSVLGNAAASSIGVSGLAVQLAGADTAKPAGISLRIPADTVSGLYGADYLTRMRWVEFPAGTTKAELSRGIVKPSAVPMVAAADHSSVLTPQISSRPMILAASSSPVSSGGAGTWAATSLRPSGAWQVSTQAGDFTYSYPFRLPPAAAGPAPDVELSYDSGSVDGETASTNNQSSVIGDGWQFSGGGFIERSYLPCSQDGTGLSGAQATSDDLCWSGNADPNDHNDYNDTISLAGHSGRLIPTSTAGEFRIQGDDGSRVQYLPHTSLCGDGGLDNGCWQLTAQDGTVFFFGRNANSAWTVPVYGDDNGDECYHQTGTDFAHSVCAQPWRWNLDRVVDLHGNAENFTYGVEKNYYHQNNGGLVQYTRGGYLIGIDYGIASGTTTASDNITFGYSQYGRCDGSDPATNCALDTNGKAISPQFFPDVPWDQYCSAGDACTGLNSPTFFSTRLLSTVTTNALASSTMTQVEQWTLNHTYVDPGDTSAASLWLDSISHAGLSDTSFDPTSLYNRVKFDTYLPMAKQRIGVVHLDTGGEITVAYDNPDCTTSMIATLNPASNTHQCFPQWWTPAGNSKPILDWFNKYRVKQISETPLTGRTDDNGTLTSYVYTSNPAWRLDTSPSTLGVNRTWSTYAGYKTVEVRKGSVDSPTTQESVDYQYFQGLDHDPDGSASNTYKTSGLSADGHAVTDSLWLAGRLFEIVTHANGGSGLTGSDVISDSVTVPWAATTASHSQALTFTDPTPNATDSMSATIDAGAYMANDGTAYVINAVASGTTRTGTTTTSYDSRGRPTSVQTSTPDAGSTCTTTDYADNPTIWLLNLPARVHEVGVACGVTPTYPQDAVSDTRYFYDGATSYTGQTPIRGNLTETDVVKDYNGTGTDPAEVVITSKTPNDTTGYYAMGRLLKSTNAENRVTTNAYLPQTTGPMTSTTVTVAAGTSLAQTTTTTYSPQWGTPTSATDPNGNLTTASYDSLGRRTSVWLPDRPVSAGAHTGTASIAYTYTQSASRALVVETSALNSSGTTVDSYAFADGLGRPIQTQTPMDSFVSNTHVIGGTILTDTYYDYAGRVRLTKNSYGNAAFTPADALYNPSSETQIPSETQTTWDGAGRKTADITLGLRSDASFGELWRTSYAYPGTDRTDTTPPAGGTPSSTWTDSRGRTTTLGQYLTATVTGTPQKTTYGYDARGDLTSMADATLPTAHTWSWTYDPRGQLSQSTDPDTGTTKNTYDVVGNLTDVEDALHNKLHFSYDLLDRKTAEYEYTTTPTAGNEAEVASWAYDTATLGKGLLASSASYVGSTNTTVGTAYTKTVGSYNPNGKPLTVSTIIPNWNGATGTTPFSSTLTYNSAGDLSSYTEMAVGGLPSERPAYFYDALSNLTRLSGIMTDIDYTHVDQPALMVFTNGSTEVDRQYHYDDSTYRLTSLLVNGQSGSTTKHVANHVFAYDNAGLLTSDSNTADGQATDLQCYSYDGLDQLADAWTSTHLCSDAKSSASLAGPAPYWNSYSYDTTTGNRTTSLKHATAAGGTDTRLTYSYTHTPAGSAPHGLAGTTTATAPAGTSPTGSGWTTTATGAYGYDADGNTTTRPGQSLTWNKEGKLAHAVVGTSTVDNIYDADGNLLLQTDSVNGTTLYLGTTELHIAKGSTTVTGVRTYSVNGMPVAERVTTAAAPTTAKLYWLNPSALGQNTAGDEVDATSLAVTHRYDDPFGNARGTPPAWTSTHNFLNAPVNATTATTHLGDRDYDAVTGRFLSADPVLDLSNPLQNNGYTYGWNDPVQNADPSGDRPAGSKDDTDAGDHGGITSCPSCSNPTKRFTADDGWTDKTVTIDTKTVQVTVTTPNPGCERFKNASLCGETKTMSLYALMHPPPGARNFCGGWSWACTLVGYNQARNCIADPSFSQCAQAVLALVSDVTLIGGVAKLADVMAEAAIALGADSTDSVISLTTDETISTAPDAAAADVDGDDVAGSACAGQSFTPETRVVMADGTSKPLGQIRVGDKVETTNPATSITHAETVTKVWINHDTDLLDVTVKAGGSTSVVHATQKHLFWDVTRRVWMQADHLLVGDLLRTDNGLIAAVASTQIVPGSAEMWDLTVTNDQDFYVVAAARSNVLVHNCPTADSRGSTGRAEPSDLKEQLAMQQVMADPRAGKIISGITMSDDRWPAGSGWVKMQQKIRGINIHYVYNTITHAADDFKFK